ncbi:MAG TPA: CapA family protein, partial [Jiangellaceae bacterium]|nr:CapA family protein [Jiangellaceae bacterium]
RLASWVQARKVEVIAESAGRRPGPFAPDQPGRSLSELAADDIAARMAVTRRSDARPRNAGADPRTCAARLVQHTVRVKERSLFGAAAAAALLLAAACSGQGGSAAAPTASPSDDTPASAPTPTPRPRTFSIVASGDVLLHERLWRQAESDAARSGAAVMDFTPQLANIAPVVSTADLAICHLEVPLASSDGPYSGYPTFAGPPQVVTALVDTGYDACTTASNHSFDAGADGIERTLAALDAAGLAHAGSARTPEEAGLTTTVDVATGEGPVRVALLSYTYGFNGIPYPNGDTWRANEIDEARILADATRARERGADVVVVAMHWGTEYDHDPNEQQLALAPRLIASPDIDLLLGHHAHVVQPVENIGGEWVVYGMGNLMANHAEPEGPKAEGVLLRFTFREDMAGGRFTTTRAEYLPLYQTYEFPVEVLDVPASLASGDTGTTTVSRLETALARTAEVVTARGGAEHGLVPLAR